MPAALRVAFSNYILLNLSSSIERGDPYTGGTVVFACTKVSCTRPGAVVIDFAFLTNVDEGERSALFLLLE